MQINTTYRLVSEMNEAFGNPRGKPALLDWQKLERQVINIGTEISEARTAIASKDLDKLRDALCDIRVFAYGAFHLAGDSDSHINRLIVEGTEKQPKFTPFEASKWRDLSDDIDQIGIILFNVSKGTAFKHKEGLDANLKKLLTLTLNVHYQMNINAARDMRSVISALYSRFCQDSDSLILTLSKYKDLEVEVYHEGDFPRVCVKSARDQVDKHGDKLPKGKFLKAHDFTEPVFYDVMESESCV
jgi:hypothetical protein